MKTYSLTYTLRVYVTLQMFRTDSAEINVVPIRSKQSTIS